MHLAGLQDGKIRRVFIQGDRRQIYRGCIGCDTGDVRLKTHSFISDLCQEDASLRDFDVIEMVRAIGLYRGRLGQDLLRTGSGIGTGCVMVETMQRDSQPRWDCSATAVDDRSSNRANPGRRCRHTFGLLRSYRRTHGGGGFRARRRRRGGSRLSRQRWSAEGQGPQISGDRSQFFLRECIAKSRDAFPTFGEQLDQIVLGEGSHLFLVAEEVCWAVRTIFFEELLSLADLFGVGAERQSIGHHIPAFLLT